MNSVAAVTTRRPADCEEAGAIPSWSFRPDAEELYTIIIIFREKSKLSNVGRITKSVWMFLADRISIFSRLFLMASAGRMKPERWFDPAACWVGTRRAKRDERPGEYVGSVGSY